MKNNTICGKFANIDAGNGLFVDLGDLLVAFLLLPSVASVDTPPLLIG